MKRFIKYLPFVVLLLAACGSPSAPHADNNATSSAIVKVRLWNGMSTPLTITEVVLRDGSDTLAIVVDTTGNTDYSVPSNLTIPAGDSLHRVLVPIRPIDSVNLTIEIYCTDGSSNYHYSCTNRCLNLKPGDTSTARVKLATGPGNYMTKL